MTDRIPDQVLTADDAARIQYQCERAGSLPMWTVTERPTDYPGHFVARLYVVPGAPHGCQYVIVGATLDDVRAQLPCTLSCMPRHPSDDPIIVESWF